MNALTPPARLTPRHPRRPLRHGRRNPSGDGKADRASLQPRLRLLLLPRQDQPLPGRGGVPHVRRGPGGAHPRLHRSEPGSARLLRLARREPTLAGLDFFRRVVELQERHLPRGWSCLNNLQTNGTRLDDAWCTFSPRTASRWGSASMARPASMTAAAPIATASRLTPGRCGGWPVSVSTVSSRMSSAPSTRGPPPRRSRSTVSSSPRGCAGCSSCPWSSGRRRRGHRALRYSGGDVGLPLHRLRRMGAPRRGRIAVQNFAEALQVVSGQPANLCVMSETCGRVLALEHDGSVYACDHFVDSAHRLGNVLSDGLGTLVESPAQLSFGEAKKSGCRALPRLPGALPLQWRLPQGPLRPHTGGGARAQPPLRRLPAVVPAHAASP